MLKFKVKGKYESFWRKLARNGKVTLGRRELDQWELGNLLKLIINVNRIFRCFEIQCVGSKLIIKKNDMFNLKIYRHKKGRDFWVLLGR